MASPQAYVASLASTLIRVLSFVFLRWIPGHQFPPIIFALAAIYVITFATCALKETQYEVVAEEIDITVKHLDGNGETSHPRLNGSAIDDTSSDEEVEVDTLQVVDEKPERILRTLLTGLPSPSSTFWSAVSFLSNAFLVFMVCQYVFQAAWYHQEQDLSFARLGYVSHHDARILVREPDSTQYPLYLSYRYVDLPVVKGTSRSYDSSWHSAGGISELTEATDYTTTFTISNLKSSTRYQYAISNGISGHLATAPKPGSWLHHDATATTENDKITFIHSSCIIPNFPFNPFAHALSIPGFRHLATWLKTIRPSFMLFLGDFIYADVPHRHGKDAETYRRAYRHVYGSPDWPSVSKVPDSATGLSYSLPWLHVYDDHEIANDWNANTTGIFPAAFDPYLHYHLAPGPPLPSTHVSLAQQILPSAADTTLTPHSLAYSNTPTYRTFTHGPASFFLLDTRRHRTPANTSNPHDPHPTILGPSQLSALQTWLRDPFPGTTWKILITSVPLTKNWRVNAHDTWAGYLHERRIVLEELWAAQAFQDVGVTVLSGDRHEFAATALVPPPLWLEQHGVQEAEATVVEFSNSPLSQFYLPVRTYQEDDAVAGGRRGNWNIFRWNSWLPSLLPNSVTTRPDMDGEEPELLISGSSERDTEHDFSLAYIPVGNSKFGVVEIERPTASGQSVFRYRCVVDGKEVWSHLLVSRGAISRKGRKRSVLEEGLWG